MAATVETRATRIAMRIATYAVLGFIFLPLAVILIYAFNPSVAQTWPPPGFTTKWFTVAFHDGAVRSALLVSVEAGILATAVALVLGSLAAFAVHRFRFFGRETVSFLLILPIALPGVVTGIALNSAFDTVGATFGLLTIVIGHATFCVVVVYNNVIARLRRTPGSLVEASMDLGADGWQTFRYVTWPSLSTALVAGGLLAFALSFDELIVTNFTAGSRATLPIWVFNNLLRPRARPVVNVVALFIVVASFVPVYLAQRLTQDRATLAPATTTEVEQE